MKNLEVIAKNRWHEPLATWPIHNENHRTTLMGNSIFDGDCLRCWIEKVAVAEYEKITEDPGDYLNEAWRSMLGEYIMKRVQKHIDAEAHEGL